MHIRIELNIPNWTKWLIGGVAIGIVLGVGATRVYADTVSVPNSFAAGNTLTADALNANFKALQDGLNALVPPGTVVAYAGEIDGNPGSTLADAGAPKHLPPNGWLWCNGDLVSRTQYAALFAAVQVAHGIGDAVSTFNLPDYRGMFLRGVNATASRDPDATLRKASANGANAGNSVGSIQQAATALPNSEFQLTSAGTHNHGGSTATESSFPGFGLWYDYAVNQGAAVSSGGFGLADTTKNGATHVHNISSDGAHTHSLTGGDTETRPVNSYVNYLIKY